MPSKDLAVWNVMVSGYVDVGKVDAAVLFFEAMPVRDVGLWNMIVSGFCKVGDVESASNTSTKC